MSALRFEIVVPTAGRPSLATLLEALAGQSGSMPERVIVVDDRPRSSTAPLLADPPGRLASRIITVRSGGAGPAAARNAGWRCTSAEWVAFLDDDVCPPTGWSCALVEDLGDLSPTVAGSQGRVEVPLPGGRRPTDWERNVAGLARARFATADMAYRRAALEAVGGFDERFRHAYREDADLALRVLAAGGGIAQGARTVTHPPGRSTWWMSVRLQRGNSDDALMRRLHGARWRRLAGAPRGRLPRHTAIVLAAGVAAAGAASRRPALARTGALLCGAGLAELSLARIMPGPRTPSEVARMTSTSAVLPFAAVAHRAQGWWRWRRAAPLPIAASRPAAVLFDRDGTLIEDVPYNGDPDLVRPMPGAEEALAELRAAGVALAVVSNQSGIARGLLSERQVQAVDRRAEELLGPLGAWLHCPHAPEDRCACRKPAPGLVLAAARALGVEPHRCALIGDIGSDMEAAAAAGARGVLVPGPQTRDEEIASAPEVAPNIAAAVQLLLGSRHLPAEAAP